MSKVEEALTIAMEAHQGQKRKISGVPFIVHPLRVAELLIMEDAAEYVVVAALLHDVLEDTTYPKEKLQVFGPEALRLIDFCTEPNNTPDMSDEESSRTWKNRKSHAIAACKDAQDDELLLKLADVLANLSSLLEDVTFGTNVWSFLNAPKEEQEWYYTSLGTIFSERFGESRLYKLYHKALGEVFKK